MTYISDGEKEAGIVDKLYRLRRELEFEVSDRTRQSRAELNIRPATGLSTDWLDIKSLRIARHVAAVLKLRV